jgi:cytochrome c
MDSFELNKILGAILGTALVTLALNITANAIFTPPKPEKPGYDIPVPEQVAPGKAGPAEPEQPLEARLATSDPKRGEATAKQCAACHTLEKGGPNRVGPNLWGVINRPRASVPGFNYSAAMKNKGGVWTYEELDKYLLKPNAMVPGTTMTFAGISRANQRADLINYLHTLADNPPPLPTKAADAGTPGGTPQQGAQPAPGGQPADAGAQPDAQSGQAPKPQ